MGEASREIFDREGVVKWFDAKKGFGFIRGPDEQDVFAHYSKIEGDGYRVLDDGATVIYDAVLGEKGWNATRIVRKAEITVTASEPHASSRPTRR